jgi:hypothetical protein
MERQADNPVVPRRRRMMHRFPNTPVWNQLTRTTRTLVPQVLRLGAIAM